VGGRTDLGAVGQRNQVMNKGQLLAPRTLTDHRLERFLNTQVQVEDGLLHEVAAR
jgi:hypothetical protein